MADQGSVRVDRWLLATRSFKTRSQASAACAAGQVSVNGHPAKAARRLVLGDRVEVRSPRGLRVLEVRALAEKRLSASAAAELFIDHSPPPPTAPPAARRDRGAGRPTKRERRKLRALRED